MKNNKGFMLAEVVVTSTIVLTTLISLYATFTKLYTKYETNSKYFDIDGIYAIKAVLNTKLESGDLNNIIKTTNTNNYASLLTTNVDSIKDTYNIENMYIVKKSNLDTLKEHVLNNTFKDYLEYMKKYYKTSDNNYNYYIVAEYKNNDKYYYSSLKLGWYNV